tara:strand:- start:420 stop:1085 length:666 start_codon:yes stop_codon:yes gene_type:complete
MKYKKFVGEFVGTFLLTSCVIGSGIMAENLSSGNMALALLCNTIATGSILYVIIKMFSSISGAHFNPIVSVVIYFNGELNKANFLLYVFFQVFGGYVAILITHFMFNLDLFQVSNNHRGEFDMLISELIATFGLVLTILLVRDNDNKAVATAVALYIMAGYWFTPSTSFANPAVLIARSFTNTFTGISPSSFIYFFLGQLFGGVGAFLLYKTIKKESDIAF